MTAADLYQAESDAEVRRSRADFTARQEVVKRLPEHHAAAFRAHRLSVPEFLVKGDLVGCALEAALAALTDTLVTVEEQSAEFRAKSEMQARWRDEEIRKARLDMAQQHAAQLQELSRLREVAAKVRRASMDGRKTLRVADLIEAMEGQKA